MTGGSNNKKTSNPNRRNSSSHWFSNLFHSNSTSSTSTSTINPTSTSSTQASISDQDSIQFNLESQSSTSPQRDSKTEPSPISPPSNLSRSDSNPKHKRSLSSWRSPFSSFHSKSNSYSSKDSNLESANSVSPQATITLPPDSTSISHPQPPRRTSTNLSYSNCTIGSTPSSSKNRSNTQDSGKDDKVHPNSSHRHSAIGLIKSIGNGIHSLPSRYNHSRNASETFKQMRAREGEEIQVARKEDGNQSEGGADGGEKLALKEFDSRKEMEENKNHGLGKQERETLEGEEKGDKVLTASETIPSIPISSDSSVPQMDSSASIRQVPSNPSSKVVSQSVSPQTDEAALGDPSIQEDRQRSSGPTLTVRATREMKDEVETLKESSSSKEESNLPTTSQTTTQSIEASPSPPIDPTTTKSVTSTSPSPIEVPKTLETGEVMLKVTPKKVMKRVFRIDADRGQILWDSKKKNKVDLESIREVRVGSSATSYRVSLSISAAHEPRWLSIIYQTQGRYKALHLIALTDASLSRWKDTLSALQGLRKSLMGGLGLIEQRQEVWLRQHWKEADSSGDEKLDFEEMSLLCKRLGIESSRKELRNRFQEADEKKRGFLDFKDFQRFVKLLKRREEVEEIFQEISDVWVEVGTGPSKETKTSKDESEKEQPKSNDEPSEKLNLPDQDPVSNPSSSPSSSSVKVRGITASRFRRFLHEEQMMSSLTSIEVSKVFEKHHTPSSSILSMSSNPEEDTEGLATGSALLLDGFSTFLMSADNSILLDQSPLVVNQKNEGKSQTNSSACSSLKEGLISSGKLEDSSANSKPPTSTISSNPKPRSAAETTEELLAASAPRQAPIHHDMTRPLSEYFISSSHNTYLVGGQWKGDSTVEGYVRALQQGARSVELDCWDGPNSIPQITHGRTLTSKVPFSDVISAIAHYAFVASPYPLILSLEVHNDLPQQDIMAKILREKLGDMLLTEKLKGFGEEKNGEIIVSSLPSPEDLKGKVLIKTKNLYVAEEEKRKAEKSELAVDQAVVAEGQTTSTDTTESDGDGLFANARDLVRQVTKRSNHSSTSKESSSNNKVLMSSDLASLLVYTVGVKHRGLNKKENYAVEHMISLSEKSAFKYIRDKNATEDLIKHNRNHLTRIYPSMSSIARLHASANFSPHHVWAAGCQLVALNWQTLDLGFEINQALFNRNGKCGYVLKPDALRIKEIGKNSGEKIRLAIDVTIISAQQLPRFKDSSKDKDGEDGDAIDPFVAVSIQTPEGWGPQPSSGETSSNPFGPGLTSSGSRDSLLGGSNAPVIGSPPGRVSAQNSPTTRHLRLPSGGSGASLGIGSKPSNSNSSSSSVGLFHSGVSPSATSPISIPGNASSSQPLDPSNNNVNNPNLLTPPPRSSSPAPPLGSSPPASFPGTNLRRNFSSSSLSSTSSRNSTQLNQRTSRLRTRAIKGNGFNPIWKHKITIYLDVPAGEKTLTHLGELEKERAKSKGRSTSGVDGDSSFEDQDSKDKSSNEFQSDQIHSLCRGLLDLCFLRFEVAEEEGARLERENNNGSGNNPGSSNTSSSGSSAEGSCIAACTLCLGSMQQGYRHVPLYDSQLSQYLFSTLFVHSKIRFVGLSGGTNSLSKK